MGGWDTNPWTVPHFKLTGWTAPRPSHVYHKTRQLILRCILMLQPGWTEPSIEYLKSSLSYLSSEWMPACQPPHGLSHGVEGRAFSSAGIRHSTTSPVLLPTSSLSLYKAEHMNILLVASTDSLCKSFPLLKQYILMSPS